jgi:hypothetical protein
MAGRKLAAWPSREESMDKFIPEKPPSRRGRWTMIFGLNLVVPLYFGDLVTIDGGRIGMAAGIGLLWSLGYRLSGMSDAWGRALLIGGTVVAATQLLPILQIFVGLVSVSLAGAQFRVPVSYMRVKGEIGGFIATFSMGLIMMSGAALVGAIGSAMFPRRPGAEPGPAPAGPLFDRQLDG